jgi:hypothetical protein
MSVSARAISTLHAGQPVHFTCIYDGVPYPMSPRADLSMIGHVNHTDELSFSRAYLGGVEREILSGHGV